MDLIKKYILLVPAIILLISNIITVYYFLNNPKVEEKIVYECENSEEEVQNVANTFDVDIKGYVKNPGVYKVNEGSTVNDLINVAGGLLKNGSTKNLNLSKKLVDEALVVVSSKYSLQAPVCSCQEDNTKQEENKIKSFAEDENNFALAESKSSVSTNDTNKSNNSTSNPNSKININTASVTELTNIPGIGQSKAEKIIE